MLSHASNGSVEEIILASGDGDFEPLVRELMRYGIEVHVWALSSGLNPNMVNIADSFVLLDEKMFYKQEEKTIVE